MAYGVCSRTGQHFRARSLENSGAFYPQNSSLCRDRLTIETDNDQPLDFSKKSSSSDEAKKPDAAGLPNLDRKPAEIYRLHADVDRNDSPSQKRVTPHMPLLPQLLTSSRFQLPQPPVKDKSTGRIFLLPEPHGVRVSADVTSPEAQAPNSSPKRPIFSEALPAPVQNVPARDMVFEPVPSSAPAPLLMPRIDSVISERSRSLSSTPAQLSAVSPAGFTDSCFPHSNGFGFGPKGLDKSGLLANGGGILRTVLEPSAQRESASDKKATKVTRPFKAYNPLPNPFPSGLPILPMGIMQDFEDQEYRYQRYVEQYYASRAVEAKKPKMEAKAPNHESNPSENGTTDELRESPSTSGTTDSSPTQDYSQSVEIGEDSNSSDSRTQQVADTSTSQGGRSNGVKRGGRSLPDAYKDAAYWERRRKNNEAAKRSRDSRRQKEDFIAMRARFLEDENKNLRLTVAFLRQELNTIKCCAAHNHNRF